MTQKNENNISYKNHNEAPGEGQFISIYGSLISIFIGFSLPMMFDIRIKLGSPLEVLSYAFLAIGILFFFKKLTLIRADNLSLDLAYLSKKQFKKVYFYYIYFFTEFVFYPLILGFYLANIFFT